MDSTCLHLAMHFDRKEMVAVVEYKCNEAETEDGYLTCGLLDCVWQLCGIWPSKPCNSFATGYVYGFNGTLLTEGWVPVDVLADADDYDFEIHS